MTDHRTTTDEDERVRDIPPVRRRISTRALVLVGLAVSLVLAGVVSFYASSHPDGLQSVAGAQGFLGSATDHAGSGSPFADYATRGIDDARLSGGLAGVVGVLVVGGLAFVLFRLLGRRGRPERTDD